MLDNISIVGSGSWATALVKVFSDSGISTSWLVRDSELAAQIIETGRNPRYLSYVDLDITKVKPCTNIEDVINGSSLIVFAVPSVYLQNYLNAIDPSWLNNKTLAVSIKSFIPGTAMLPSVFVKRHTKVTGDVLVIGGPCHAEEIATKRKTYITIASHDHEKAESLRQCINTKYIQAVSSNDPSGIEYVAILKNIVGIAIGMAVGLSYGENFIAVLVSNAMREVRSILSHVNPRERELFDSAYFGDLLVTAYSDFSRNRTLGKLIGRGIRVQEALQAMEMVAEGFKASAELAVLLGHNALQLPIINGVHRILHMHASAYHEFKLIENQLK